MKSITSTLFVAAASAISLQGGACPKQMPSSCKDAFGTMKADDEGNVGEKELKWGADCLLKNPEIKKHWKGEADEKMLREAAHDADKNGDGKLNVTEFVPLCQKAVTEFKRRSEKTDQHACPKGERMMNHQYDKPNGGLTCECVTIGDKCEEDMGPDGAHCIVDKRCGVTKESEKTAADERKESEKTDSKDDEEKSRPCPTKMPGSCKAAFGEMKPDNKGNVGEKELRWGAECLLKNPAIKKHWEGKADEKMLVEAAHAADKNGDEKLNEDEFVLLCKKVVSKFMLRSAKPSKKVVRKFKDRSAKPSKKVVRKFKDRSAKLSKKVPCPTKMPKSCEAAFGEMKPDKEGNVDEKQLRWGAECLLSNPEIAKHWQGETDEKMLVEAARAADKNGDEKLSEKEFLPLCKSVVKKFMGRQKAAE